MGDSIHFSYSGNNSERRAITSKKLSKRCLLASTPISQKTLKCIDSMKQGMLGSGAASDVGLFLLKTAALYLVRRFSRANCPFVWSGLQALQILCYPPFKWIQKWAPFKGLIAYMQTLSKPLLALTIATVFADQSTFMKEALDRFNGSLTFSESESGTSAQSSTPDTRSSGEVPKAPASEKWLLQLYKELEKQGIVIPERYSAGVRIVISLTGISGAIFCVTPFRVIVIAICSVICIVKDRVVWTGNVQAIKVVSLLKAE